SFALPPPNSWRSLDAYFKTEATALHSLGHHPQIPELLAYFEEAEKFYLVQQYIAGQTLDQKLIPQQPWPAGQVVELLRDCLNILRFIHDQGVIHRDLKPANLILRDADHKIVLVDFGTVKNILQGQGGLEQLTVAVGTQGYMPIEQARGKPNSTSDLYALGIIGIQALTGVKPLDLEEDEHGEIIWSPLANAQPELIEILTKMTRYNYLERYPSAQSVLDALDSCCDTLLPQAVPGMRTTSFPVSTDQSIDQSMLQPPPREYSSQVRPNPNEDPNALPGVRSVAVVNRPSSRLVQPQATSQVLGQKAKIAVMAIVIAGGIYLSLKQLFPQPASDISSPEATSDPIRQ
ncbi:MAG: serine/threonine protein kinase, partial [Hydrococcus sp. SU_1_0]|nr:serine/threonine protein kinase [Hydrococcus sp. SU_1_0]